LELQQELRQLPKSNYRTVAPNAQGQLANCVVHPRNSLPTATSGPIAPNRTIVSSVVITKSPRHVPSTTCPVHCSRRRPSSIRRQSICVSETAGVGRPESERKRLEWPETTACRFSDGVHVSTSRVRTDRVDYRVGTMRRPTSNPGKPQPVTVAQAIDLLRNWDRDRNCEGVLIIIVESSPRKLKPRRDGDASKNPSDNGTRRGLARIGEPAFENITKLTTFYLIGCAYESGCTSLLEVSQTFRARVKTLPPKVRPSLTNLTKVVRSLEREVFSRFFGTEDHVWLLRSTSGEGRGKTLTPAGRQAWDATRQFLQTYASVPNWQISLVEPTPIIRG
jgi:hypothetical protein